MPAPHTHANINSEDQATMAANSLTDLSTEIRLEICSNFTSIDSPVKEHIDSIKGLLLSCKTIHEELQGEILRNTNQYLSNMKEEWTLTSPTTKLLTSSPSTLTEVQKGIKISIPNTFFRDLCAAEALENANGEHATKNPGLPRALVRILPLHVQHITVNTYEDDDKEASKSNITPLKEPIPINRFFWEFHKLLSAKDNRHTVHLDDGTNFFNMDYPLCVDSLTFNSALTLRTTRFKMLRDIFFPNNIIEAPIVEHFMLHPVASRNRNGSLDRSGRWGMRFNVAIIDDQEVLAGKTFRVLKKADKGRLQQNYGYRAHLPYMFTPSSGRPWMSARSIDIVYVDSEDDKGSTGA